MYIFMGESLSRYIDNETILYTFTKLVNNGNHIGSWNTTQIGSYLKKNV